MTGFVGRTRELTELRHLLAAVEAPSRTDRPGRAVLMRGRRRVGKSRLAEEFISATGLPNFYFMATGGTPAQDLTGFAEDLRLSSLPGAAEINEAAPTSWDAAFRLLAGLLPEASASIVVLDEVPYLAAADPSFEGALQKAFDRSISRRPVVLILIGSNTAFMEQLSTHGRPFYQRGTELVVPPLSPADVATMLELDAADAVDAYLVTGGLPLALEEWPVGGGLWDYLASSLHRPTSALIVSGERVLAAEFPVEAQARLVLQAIGHGERTLSLIGRSAGDMPTATLVRAVHLLAGRRMVAADLPLSTSPSKLTRYRIADPALRFWLTFVRPAMSVIERGRGDLALDQIRQRWSGWRGRAVEPVVRDALVRLADVHLPPGTREIGGYWTRTNDPEIDLVGADRGPVAQRITCVGSVKWHETAPFSGHDLAGLVRHRAQLPGADEHTPLIAVSRLRGDLPGVTMLGADDLLEAWPT